MIVCEETSELKAARRSRSRGSGAADDDDRESMMSMCCNVTRSMGVGVRRMYDSTLES